MMWMAIRIRIKLTKLKLLNILVLQFPDNSIAVDTISTTYFECFSNTLTMHVHGMQIS